jgi:hypothetical protein
MMLKKKPERGLISKKEAKKGVARREDTLDEAPVFSCRPNYL